MPNSHYDLKYALFPARYLYDQANKITVDATRTRPKFVKILAYRVVSLPVGSLAIAISISQLALTSFLSLVTLKNPTCVRWRNLSRDQGYHSLILTVRSTIEIYHVAKAILFGSYKSSYIFSHSDLHNESTNVIDQPENNIINRSQLPPRDDETENNPPQNPLQIALEQDQKINEFFVRHPGNFTMRVRGDQTPFLFHRELLNVVHAPFLRGLVNAQFQENLTNEANDFDCSLETMRAFRRFFYTGYSTHQPTVILELLNLAHMMEFTHLEEHCHEMLKNKIDSNNVLSCLTTAVLINSTKLQYMCFEFIKKNLSQEFLQFIHTEGLADQYAFFNAITNQHPNIYPPIHPPVNRTRMFTRGSLGGITFNSAENENIIADRLILDLKSPTLANYFARQPQENINVDVTAYSKETVEDLLTFIYHNEIEVPAWRLVKVYHCATHLLGEADNISEKLWKILSSKINKVAQSSEYLERRPILDVANPLRFIKVINTFFSFRMKYLIESHAQRPCSRDPQHWQIENPFFDIIQEIGTNSFYLTELNLSTSTHLLGTYPGNSTYHDFANLFCKAVGRWCPNLQVLELPLCEHPQNTKLFNPAQIAAQIRASRIFECCPFLPSVKVGELVINR